MTVAELLEDLTGRGVELRAEGSELVIRALKGVLTREHRVLLTEHKAEILEVISGESSEPLISSPLSYNQMALWVLYSIAPSTSAYNVAFAARVRCEVDVTALRRAFQKLIDRHPSLRSTYGTEGEEPVQHVYWRRKVHFDEINASGFTDEQLHNLVVAEYKHPFDLEAGPMLRAALFTRSGNDHVLLITVHHIACDGSSLMLLLDELGRIYPAQVEGARPVLPNVESQYINYVRWQKRLLESSEGQALLSYWQEQLSGEIKTLDLPVDRPRPPKRSFAGASLALNLDEGLTSRLKELSKAEDVTLYVTLLAAYQTLLHRYTNQETVLVGTPTFGRSQAEFARVIGHFVNPVVLRGDFGGDPSFREFLRRVRSTVLAALEHQDYPFPLLVDRLQPARDLSRTPIFQAFFVLQRLHGFGEMAELFKLGESDTVVKFGGLELSPFPMAQQEGQFDLKLEMAEVSSSLFGVLQYDTDMFDAATMSRMATHFQTLLESIVNSPDQRVSSLKFLSDAETLGYSESDFPDADLSRREFERLIMEIGRIPHVASS